MLLLLNKLCSILQYPNLSYVLCLKRYDQNIIFNAMSSQLATIPFLVVLVSRPTVGYLFFNNDRFSKSPNHGNRLATTHHTHFKMELMDTCYHAADKLYKQQANEVEEEPSQIETEQPLSLEDISTSNTSQTSIIDYNVDYSNHDCLLLAASAVKSTVAVKFKVGDKFSTYQELQQKVKEFEQYNFV